MDFSAPHSVLAAGWIPFVVVTMLILVFSFIYVRYYQHRYDKELCSTLVSILGLALALFTCALLPVDIFLVSFMKHSNGTFKEWAADNATRRAVENGVLYTYYALFGCVMLFLFIVVPMAYFFYEEGDEESTTRSRCCSAFKYSVVFMLVGAIIFIIGICVPFKGEQPHNDTGIEWAAVKHVFTDINGSRAENALSFLISFLSLIGMVAVTVYTGIGMAVWPIHLIKGRRSIIREYREVSEERAATQTRIEAIRNRYTGGSSISRRDRRSLEELEDREELMSRRERHLEAAERSCLRRCSLALRPFQIIFGVLFLLIAVFIALSLTLTNVDRIIHSNARLGYVLFHRGLPDLLDIVYVFAQKVFPLDYILLCAVVIFLVFCSMGGINAIGIWFCWIKMYQIRASRTKPQALLFLCYILMFIVLALNVLLYQVMPQYYTYGSQHYIYVQNKTENIVKPCTTSAPVDECTMTRMGMLLLRFFYKMWFFGAAYYWMTWAFLGVFVMSFIVAIVRKRRSSIEGEVNEEDFDSDDEMIST